MKTDVDVPTERSVANLDPKFKCIWIRIRGFDDQKSEKNTAETKKILLTARPL
jgi:hypothetical protein